MASVVASIEDEHTRNARMTDELREFCERVCEGDRVEVRYESANGLQVSSTGIVSQVERLDGNFDDLRFEAGEGECYLHLNPSCGAYYFTNEHRETPELGHKLVSVTLQKRARSA